MTVESRCLPLALALFLTVLCACTAGSLSQTFRPEPVPREPLVEDLFVVVEGDERPLGGRSRVGTGFLSWIPLVPYGHQQFSPEFGTLMQGMEGSFPGEVAATLIEDLRAAGIARRIRRPEDLIPGMPEPKEPYTLQLTLTEGVFHRYITLYGMSFAGVVLWVVGLPASYGNAELGFVAEMRDPEGRSLGEQEFRARDRAAEWLYYPMNAAYPPAMTDAYTKISGPLRSFVAEALADR